MFVEDHDSGEISDTLCLFKKKVSYYVHNKIEDIYVSYFYRYQNRAKETQNYNFVESIFFFFIFSCKVGECDL